MTIPDDLRKQVEQAQHLLSDRTTRSAMEAAKAAAGQDTEALPAMAGQPAIREAADLVRGLGSSGMAELGKLAAGPSTAELARQATPADAAGLTSAVEAARRAAGPDVRELMQQAAGIPQDAISGLVGALASVDPSEIGRQLGVSSTEELAERLGASGVTELVKLAHEVGATQREALNKAFHGIANINTDWAQDMAGQIAALQESPVGEISAGILRGMGEQVAALRHERTAARFTREVDALRRGVEEALTAPARVAAQELGEIGPEADLGGIEAAAAYLTKAREVLPRELRAQIDVPSIPVSPETERQFFDRQARALMGMSGEEFLRRWESGEFRAFADDPDHTEIVRLAAMIPIAS